MLVLDARGDVPFYDFQVVLSEVTYTFQFRWNVRSNAWFMSVYDESGETPIVVGWKVVVGYRLGGPLLARTIPGLIAALDTSRSNEEISEMGDLGSRVKVVYFTLEEMGIE